MSEQSFVDYYELLQISPNAEIETIHRVFKMLAQRYHPDNPQTGDVDRFLLLNQAFEILSEQERRQDYDALYRQQHAQPIELFETKDFAMGVDGEANRRMGILCLLYNRRRSNPDAPGISLLEFESIMSFPREHLMFTMWYLKEQGHLKMDESSNYVITGTGVDYVETNLPRNRVLYRLLKAAESGSVRSPIHPDKEEPAGAAATQA
jgi:curved DNA-binding protein CbpA